MKEMIKVEIGYMIDDNDNMVVGQVAQFDTDEEATEWIKTRYAQTDYDMSKSYKVNLDTQ